VDDLFMHRKKCARMISVFSLFSLVCAGKSDGMVSQSHFPLQTVIKKTHSDSPTIPGFSYSYGSVDKFLASESTGYFYYDTDVLFSQFTTNSRLYIVHIRSNFTSGSEASRNGFDSYDAHYDLWHAYVHIKAYQYSNNGKTSSSYQFIKSWPLSNSDKLTSSVSSSFGGSYTISSAISAGASFPGGAQVSRTTSTGFSLSFQNTTTLYGPEPSLTQEDDPNDQRNAAWNYQFANVYSGSYEMNCYYLFELKNDGNGYQDYSFKFDVSIKMKDIAWKGFIWQQLRDTDSTLNDSYGLY
jgi:hypothetical protein